VFVVDTNLLIYAAIRESTEHGQAARLVAGWGSSAERWYITWSIAYEFLRVSLIGRPFLARSHSPMPGVSSTASARRPPLGSWWKRIVTRNCFADLTRKYPRISGNRMHDLHIAALMREHGVVEIRTADTDFHEFKFLRVVNPL
jgi:uncharacterized protein